MPRAMALAALLSALGLIVAACGGGGDGGGGATAPTATSGAQVNAEVVTRDLVVGANRFAVGLLDAETNLILGAQVQFRFLKLEGEEQEVPKGEAPARYVALQSNFVHQHPDGVRHTHTGNEVGVYVAQFEFDSAGIWAVDVQATIDGQERGPARTAFEVLQDSAAPNVGDPAPATRQPTLTDVNDIAQLDTSAEPIAAMHQQTVADAIAAGKPAVVLFATPAFCVSRTCGPVKSEVVDPLFREYQDRVSFIHIEPYRLDADGGLVVGENGGPALAPATQEWRLQSEPWVFVIDAQGRIAARFEGVLGADELREAIEDVLAGG